jgi:aspartate aminotransferase
MESLSKVGNGIVGSEIIKISQQIKEIAKNKPVANLTIGDFDSKKWPIPFRLKQLIEKYYEQNYTNYPNSQGELSLREAVSNYLNSQYELNYKPSEILIGGGVRPLIYTVYKGTVNQGESVIYPVPSWNNNHYCFLHGATKKEIECKPENSFFPTVSDIENSIDDSTSLICICSPQNPTGRVIPSETLKGICEVIIKENKLRATQVNSRPIYLFFDQIYSDLTDKELFTHPLYVCPEIKNYLICADGISKSLSATGIRVGWIFGPQDVIGKLTEIFSHIGAWAPKPEQNAVAEFLNEEREVHKVHTEFTRGEFMYYSSLICDKIEELKEKGFRVDCQRPEGGIYISVYFDYAKSFSSSEEFVYHLINTHGLGIVPFEFFGSKENRGWFRISLGNIDDENIDEIIDIIENSVLKLHQFVNSMVF